MTHKKNKPLRITKEILAQQEADRRAMKEGTPQIANKEQSPNNDGNSFDFFVPPPLPDPNIEINEWYSRDRKHLCLIPAYYQLRDEHRAEVEAPMARLPEGAEPAVFGFIKSPRKHEQLFHENPPEVCGYTNGKNTRIKNRTHSNSRESQQNHARRELELLKRNGRIPTTEITLRFQKPFRTKKMMTDLLTRLFRYLGDRGLVAAVALEGTKNYLGRPNNRLHCHVLIDDKDSPRSKKQLIELFVKACKLRGLIRGTDIKIGYRKLPENFTFDYFVKFGKHGKDIPLFQKRLWIQKFRYIGGWFTVPRPVLWAAHVAEMKIKYSTDDTSVSPESTETST